MNEFIDRLIEEYTSEPRRKQIMSKQIEDFMRFYIITTQDREKIPMLDEEEGKKDEKKDEYVKKPVSKNNHKYKQMRTAGLAFIHHNRKEIYQKIREAVPHIHNRGKGYQSILSSKEVGSGRRRSW